VSSTTQSAPAGRTSGRPGLADEWRVVVRGLTKAYGDVTAANGVDLAVAAGSIHGLVGPNGAGKSTVLGSVLRLVASDAGTVEVHGRLAGFKDDPRFYPYLSGRLNLRILGVLDGIPRSDLPRRIDELLTRVGLAEAADRRVAGYSLGMRQRLGLAAALLRSPSVLVLDEPTNGLDPTGTAELWALLREIADSGGAVLLSSHDLAAIHEVCDAVTVMHGGRAVWSGTLAALQRNTPPPFLHAETSDDEAALAVTARIGVLAEPDEAGGIRIAGGPAELDAVTAALGRDGIGLRALVPGESPLRVLFDDLTTGGRPVSPGLAAEATPLPPPDPSPTVAEPASGALGDLAAVVRVEAVKLAHRWHVRLLALVCVVAPFVFAAGLKLSGSLPMDTLYGRWLLSSAPAFPLFALAVTGSWAFPALSSVVGGDILASEDKHGTWPLVLTRSRPAYALVVGKLVVAVCCAVLAVLLLALSATGAGLLLGAGNPLPGLSGQHLTDGHAYAVVLAAWAATVPGALAWVTIALALSAFTRSSLVGILAPALAGIVLQLTLLIDGPPAMRMFSPSAALDAWHALVEIPSSARPLVATMLVALVWAVLGAVALAAALKRRRSLAA